MKSAAKILKYFLIWRAWLFIPVLVAGYLLPTGNSFPFYQLTHYKELPAVLSSGVFTVWSNFDGVHYLNIASRGYITEARFFPLLPILIFISSLGNIYFPLTYFISLLISNLVFFAALILLHKLLRLDYKDADSFQVITSLLIFPTAFFFVSVYTEGLFLLLVAASFYFARNKNWLATSLFSMLLISTRFIGIVIIPALIYEYLISEKRLKLRNYLTGIGLIFLSLFGIISYSIFNYLKWGNFTYFLTAHTELNNGRTASTLVFPLQTLYRYYKILITIPLSHFEWWIALLEVLAFVFGIVLLFIAWRKNVRVSYLIFGSLAFLIPVLSGTFSGLPRYLLVIFPLFIGLGLVKSKLVRSLYCTISIMTLFLLLMFFSRGYFVS